MKNSKTTLPKHALDNRSNQLNPRHPEYYQCRGIDPTRAQDLVTRETGSTIPPLKKK